jgi:uncharacterized phiE125 gp8 family phage protein
MPHLTLAELKSHLRVSSNAEDTLIQLYYDAALDWVADYTGREIREATRTYVTLIAEAGAVCLPAYPVREIIKISQAGGVMLLEDGSAMLLEDGSAMLLEDTSEGLSFRSTLDVNGVATVVVSGQDPNELTAFEFSVGYADGTLPAALKQAVLFLVGHFFHNRSEVDASKNLADVPEGAKRLCDPYRVRVFAGV